MPLATQIKRLLSLVLKTMKANPTIRISRKRKKRARQRVFSHMPGCDTSILQHKGLECDIYYVGNSVG